jgi:hypothetical protein
MSHNAQLKIIESYKSIKLQNIVQFSLTKYENTPKTILNSSQPKQSIFAEKR